MKSIDSVSGCDEMVSKGVGEALIGSGFVSNGEGFILNGVCVVAVCMFKASGWEGVILNRQGDVSIRKDQVLKRRVKKKKPRAPDSSVRVFDFPKSSPYSVDLSVSFLGVEPIADTTLLKVNCSFFNGSSR